jgi:hypothetical protein
MPCTAAVLAGVHAFEACRVCTGARSRLLLPAVPGTCPMSARMLHTMDALDAVAPVMPALRGASQPVGRPARSVARAEWPAAAERTQPDRATAC